MTYPGRRSISRLAGPSPSISSWQFQGPYLGRRKEEVRNMIEKSNHVGHHSSQLPQVPAEVCQR